MAQHVIRTSPAEFRIIPVTLRRPTHRRNVDEIEALRRLDVQQVLVVIQLFVGSVGMEQRVLDRMARA
jgi:hypothetical protein